MAGRLGDILIDKGHVTQEQLESALRSQGVERGMLGAILLRRGQITLQQLGEAYHNRIIVAPFCYEPVTQVSRRCHDLRYSADRHRTGDQQLFVRAQRLSTRAADTC